MHEVGEETGLDVEVTSVVGIYSDLRHVVAYDDGEARQELSIVCHARPMGGTRTPSAEAPRARWVDAAQVGEFPIDPSMRMRMRIEYGLAEKGHP